MHDGWLLNLTQMTLCPPCPTYQLWPFSSAKENHPKMPIWDPQNEFPGIPWIGLFLAFLYSLIGNPEFPGIFRHFLGEGFWGPRIAFSGEDEVDMLGSGDKLKYVMSCEDPIGIAPFETGFLFVDAGLGKCCQRRRGSLS